MAHEDMYEYLAAQGRLLDRVVRPRSAQRPGVPVGWPPTVPDVSLGGQSPGSPRPMGVRLAPAASPATMPGIPHGASKPAPKTATHLLGQPRARRLAGR